MDEILGVEVDDYLDRLCELQTVYVRTRVRRKQEEGRQ